MTLQTILQDLVDASAPAGFETPAEAVLSAALTEAGCELRRDRLGSLLALRKCGVANAPLLMLDAHMDEIGLIVTHIDEQGFVHFGALGGVDVRTLPDSEVTVLCDPPLAGVVCCLPPHVQSSDEMKSFPKLTDLAIDCGFSAETARNRIQPGTPVVFCHHPSELLNQRFVSKALDNRISMSILTCVMHQLKDAALDYDIVMAATTMEEVGGRGARTAAFGLEPDAAIVLDVTFADAKGIPSERTIPMDELTVCVGPECDRPLTAQIRRTAEALNIPLRSEVCPRSTGTNGSDIQISRAGVPVAVLSIPVRNMHTPVEMVSLKTADHAVQLMNELLTNLKGGDLL